MADPIPPALTPERWKQVGAHPVHAIRDLCADVWGHAETPDRDDMPDIIALANAALPDDDPRKITRTLVTALRFGAKALRAHGDRLMEVGISDGIQLCQAENIEQVADALESYLPPP